MQQVWHYIKDGEFPSSECSCLCRINWQDMCKFVTLHYYGKDDWCDECSGDSILSTCVEAWADINDVLECTYS